MGQTVPIMDALYHKDGLFEGRYLDYSGLKIMLMEQNWLSRPSAILVKKKEDCTFHVRINTQTKVINKLITISRVETQMVQFECSEKIQENLILGPPPPLRALHGQRRTQKRHSPSTRQVSGFVVETKSDMCEFYSYFFYIKFSRYVI